MYELAVGSVYVERIVVGGACGIYMVVGYILATAVVVEEGYVVCMVTVPDVVDCGVVVEGLDVGGGCMGGGVARVCAGA